MLTPAEVMLQDVVPFSAIFGSKVSVMACRQEVPEFPQLPVRDRQSDSSEKEVVLE